MNKRERDKILKLVSLSWLGICMADMVMHPEHYLTEELAAARIQHIFDVMVEAGDRERKRKRGESAGT